MRDLKSILEYSDSIDKFLNEYREQIPAPVWNQLITYHKYILDAVLEFCQDAIKASEHNRSDIEYFTSVIHYLKEQDYLKGGTPEDK